MNTRAAAGLDCFDALLKKARQRTPDHHLPDITDMGRLVTILPSDAASALTSTVAYVDAGSHLAA